MDNHIEIHRVKLADLIRQAILVLPPGAVANAREAVARYEDRAGRPAKVLYWYRGCPLAGRSWRWYGGA
jgi:hypothetical protein